MEVHERTPAPHARCPCTIQSELFQKALQARRAQDDLIAARLSEAAHKRDVASMHQLLNMPSAVSSRCDLQPHSCTTAVPVALPSHALRSLHHHFEASNDCIQRRSRDHRSTEWHCKRCCQSLLQGDSAICRLVCSVCKRAMPSEHLLELHMTEAHDAFFHSQAARKQKVFACLVPACARMFKSRAERAQHLHDFHFYARGCASLRCSSGYVQW